MNLIEALQRRGIDVKRSSSVEGEFTICCPFCVERGRSQDYEHKFGFNIKSNKGHCFKCDYGTFKAITVLQRKLELGQLDGVTAGATEEKKKYPPPEIPEEFEPLLDALGTSGVTGIARRAYRYLRDRRVTREQIRRHQVGICLSGRFAYRVVFPIYYGKKLTGIVARDFTDKQKPKYLNSVGIKTLFNCPRRKEKTAAILIEGIFDSMSVERAVPVYDAIGVLGHDLTDIQLKMLEGYEKIIIWPDGDAAGLEGLLKMAPQLKDKGFDVVVVHPVEGKDPGDLKKKEIRLHLCFTKRWSEEQRTYYTYMLRKAKLRERASA